VHGRKEDNHIIPGGGKKGKKTDERPVKGVTDYARGLVGIKKIGLFHDKTR
jgi:hypothetical protein